jgi:hypothetical protein
VYIASPIMLVLAGRKEAAETKSAAQARKGGKHKKAPA